MPPDQKRDYEAGYRKPPRPRFPKVSPASREAGTRTQEPEDAAE
jgi:hypothetical protein